jgi:predicted O-linked N-acetylglucosamine transferase (SPINDLY family)
MVSPDFGLHPVGFLTIKLLENANPQDAQFFCYSDRAITDNYTKRFAEAANQWTSIYGLSDEDLAHKIQQDRIDILFDLAGHTANNRLTMFARKPSPVQISWAGYVGTTGLASMDYVLADRFHVLQGEDEHYTEKVLRLPNCYVCYDPPSYSPPVNQLPANRNGYITFGCFNNLTKINSRILEHWSRILAFVSHSKIILKYTGMDGRYNEERILSAFQNHGIDQSRIILEGGSPHKELLARYNAIDIALDTSPYSGGVTTCEALWMGVPVVTFPGQTFAGRHSLSHLSNVGFTDSIARDFDSYINTAVCLAGDLDELARIRAGLRQQMERSPLCDGPRFAEAFCGLIRQVWASFVAKS